MKYKINGNVNTKFISSFGEVDTISVNLIKDALDDVHNVIDKITNEIPVDIFSILGMRNLSSFIGELLKESISNKSEQKFKCNPHQDGYPDLLLMNKKGLQIFEQLKTTGRLRDKGPFSPFENGGIEIKATCGSVPTPAQCAKQGLTKPDMGEKRIHMMKSYDWKAHHRETNNLLGIIWDFKNNKPFIAAVFFGSSLLENDWGKIIQPKVGGGRTTSVSIMTRAGVEKMYRNWVVVADDENYIDFINRYNNGKLIY